MATPTTSRFLNWLVLSLALLTAPVPSIAEELIPFGSEWLYLQPNGTAEDPAGANRNFDTTWFNRNYDTANPTAWSGPAAEPFSRGSISVFDPGSSRFVREAKTLLPELDSGNRLTTYFRRDFTTAAEATGLSLDLVIDDGAKIYLDGNEIFALNCCSTAAPGTPASYDDTAITVGNERDYSTYRILQGTSLPAGDHTLAVAVHNRTATDSDLAFSLRLNEGIVDFVNAGQDWQYYEGFDEPSNGTLDWTQPQFDDGSWSTGPEPFGYEESAAGDPNGVFDMVDPATLLDMQGSFTTLYIRRAFDASQFEDLSELSLAIDYDDAFFAYINGQLVFSSEATHPMGDPTLSIPFDLDGAAAGFDHESTNNSTALPTEFTVHLADFPGLLNEGANNVLAIQGINRAFDSSDFLMAKISLFGSPGTAGPSVAGDFDGDGQLTAQDIDQLTGEVRNGSNDPFFDVTGDGAVDEADRAQWVEVLKFTYFGDANLDGQFNTADLVTVLTSGEYEDAIQGNSGWATGDWNGDGEFTTTDFVTALTSGGYELGPRAAVAAVPEPTQCLALPLAVVMAAGIRRNRRR